MQIKKPYLLFLGNAIDSLEAKVAQGIYDWRPENVVGQYRMGECKADLGLKDMSIDEAVDAGFKTLTIGTINLGGIILGEWIEVLSEALLCVSQLKNYLLVETLTPENDPDHWDVIEGQGSLFHPSFAGVTMGLIHGAQADALVLCHEPTRTHMRRLADYGLPSLDECMDACLNAAKLTNQNVRFVGISVNTSMLSEDKANSHFADLETLYGLPAVDPVRNGVSRIVEQFI